MKKIMVGVTLFLALAIGLYHVNNVFYGHLEMEDGINQEKDQPVAQIPKENGVEIGIRRGNVAAVFSLLNIEGQEETLWDYRGKKVILNFWSSDCPPCREEMPELNRFYLENKERDIVVLGVNLGEKHQVVKDFMKDGNYEFPVLLDEKNSVGFKYGIAFIPTTYFINEDGIIEDIHIGILTLEDLNKRYE